MLEVMGRKWKKYTSNHQASYLNYEKLIYTSHFIIYYYKSKKSYEYEYEYNSQLLIYQYFLNFFPFKSAENVSTSSLKF